MCRRPDGHRQRPELAAWVISLCFACVVPKHVRFSRLGLKKAGLSNENQCVFVGSKSLNHHLEVLAVGKRISIAAQTAVGVHWKGRGRWGKVSSDKVYRGRRPRRL